MESLLNIVWVLASLGCGCAALAHFLCRAQRRHSIGVAILALIVISVLLFPVISVTDDLNPMLFASEDATRKMSASHNFVAPAAAMIVFLCSLLVLAGLVRLGTVEDGDPLALAKEGFATAFGGRAPPFLAIF